MCAAYTLYYIVYIMCSMVYIARPYILSGVTSMSVFKRRTYHTSQAANSERGRDSFRVCFDLVSSQVSSTLLSAFLFFIPSSLSFISLSVPSQLQSHSHSACRKTFHIWLVTWHAASAAALTRRRHENIYNIYHTVHTICMFMLNFSFKSQTITKNKQSFLQSTN